MFALSNFNYSRCLLPLLRIFAATCTLVILYLFGDAFYTLYYFHLPLKNIFTAAFTNHNFSLPIALHATYMAMYTALSFSVLLFEFGRTTSKKWRLALVAGMCIQAAGLLQLGSRAVLAALLLIVIAGIAFFIVGGKKKWILTGIVVLLCIAAGLLAMQATVFRQRYVYEFKNDLANQPVADERLEPRILRWQLALDIIKKAPFTGHGNGSEKKLLKEKYFEHKFYISYLKSYNAHSQYLSLLLRCGIPGLLLFILVLAFAFRAAFLQNNFIFFSFLVLVSLVGVSENILDVNKGIFFYSFFLSLFLNNRRHQPPEATPAYL